MLRLVRPKLAVAVLLSMAIAGGLNAAALADGSSTTATSDLIPGPPSGSWTVSTDYTGPETVSDFYGSPSPSAPGFSDAYGKSWYQPEVGVYDEVARYDSLLWALYALSTFKVYFQQDPDATSVQDISGFGYGGFEVTYPADTDGYQWDEIYFAVGEYVAAVSLGATGTIVRDVLLDQSKRQLGSLPSAIAEVRSIRTGVLLALAGVLLVTSIFIAGILLLILLPLRRPAITIPPWAQISPDGANWWDGTSWRPLSAARDAKR